MAFLGVRVWRKLKRRRSSFDPLASQPRSSRRPGEFNEQTDSSLNPNVRFPGDQMGGGIGGAL
jgi:hypothetical protein